MSGWSFDMSAAPRDRQILIRSTKGETILTRWIEPTKFTPAGRFGGFPENAKTLLAWCEVPEFRLSPLDAVALHMVQVANAAAGHLPIIEDVGSI